MRGRRLAGAALGVALLAACGRASQPAPIAFDREPCAHCRMLTSDPAWAAQLESADGEVASFDDPGCLLAALDAHPNPRALWFHHLREERWLAGDEVGFVRSHTDGDPALLVFDRIHPFDWTLVAVAPEKQLFARP